MIAQHDLLQTPHAPHPCLSFGGGMRVPNDVFATMARLRYQADTGESFSDSPRGQQVLVARHPRKEAAIVTLMATDTRQVAARVCQYHVGLSGEIVPALYPWIQAKSDKLRFQSDFVCTFRLSKGATGLSVQVLCKVHVGDQLEHVWKDWVITDARGVLHEYHEGAPVTLAQAAKFATVLHAKDIAPVRHSASIWHQPIQGALLPAFATLTYGTPLLEFEQRYLAPQQARLTLERFSRSAGEPLPSSLIRL